jgi:predicted RNase H-like HicB family nuclease
VPGKSSGDLVSSPLEHRPRSVPWLSGELPPSTLWVPGELLQAPGLGGWNFEARFGVKEFGLWGLCRWVRPHSARPIMKIKPMARITVASIPIAVGIEEDGRWWADIESMPGVMAYGTTRKSAITAVRALALRVAADCIDHGEEIPEPFSKVFSLA